MCWVCLGVCGGIPIKIKVVKRNSNLGALHNNLGATTKINHIKLPKQNYIKNHIKKMFGISMRMIQKIV